LHARPEVGPPSSGPRTAQIRKASIPDLPEKPPVILPRVLFIDDSEDFIRQAKNTWETTELRSHAKFEVFHYDRSREDELVTKLAASFIDRHFYDAVYVDLNLVGSNHDAGLGLIKRLREREPRLNYIPFVAVTSFPDYELEAKAREHGAVRFLVKTEGQGKSDIFGIFVHRMIVEARETLEQSEDELWADASQRLAEGLRSKPWREACKDILDFLQSHFTVMASFARELTEGDVLRQIHANDLIDVKLPEIRIGSVPFIRDFMHAKPSGGVKLHESLGAVDIGNNLPRKLIGLRAAVALVATGDTPYGLFTLYRAKADRPFRDRDARGLRQLAMQLAFAIGADKEKERLRSRQKDLLALVREFDQSTDEQSIHERLQGALFEQIGPDIPGGKAGLKAAVRRIRQGTDEAERVAGPAGFPANDDVSAISLEWTDKCSTARVVWDGRSEYAPDISLPRICDRHRAVGQGIKASLSVPLMANGVCFGIASLESKRPEAFGADDIAYAEQLCLTAAEALLRLRTRHFGNGMAAMALNLAEPGRLSTTDVILNVVRLLADFTHFSELLYLVPPAGSQEGPWTLQSVFTRNGNRLEEDQRNLWRQRLKEHWEYSYVLKVLQSGKASAWSQEPKDLPVDDVGLPGRQGNQKTRAQSVIVVRPENGGHPDAMIALLFQHRHAVSEPMVYQLAQLGRLLASLLMQEREFRRLFGLNTIAEQEAMLGRVFGQFRHTLQSQLVVINNLTAAVEANRMPWAEASQRINDVLRKIDRDISSNQTLVKRPVNGRVNLGNLWNEVMNELAGVAKKRGGHIETNDKLTSHHIWTDRALLKSILHNLVDNALRHGGSGVQVSVEFLDQGGPPSIRIRDNGKGIAEDILPGLFQLDKPPSKDSTGMGLYLAYERAAILGADLHLEQTSPNGTCFRLSFTGSRS
jgi:signal transduction histidine kinase/GAF domain-containing protein